MKSLVPSLIFLLGSVLYFGCSQESEENRLQSGRYRAQLDAQGQILPFEFEVAQEGEDQVIYLLNAGERLRVDELTYRNDSVIIRMHIFDATLKGKINGKSLTGTWSKDYYDDYVLDMTAELTEAPRFSASASTDGASVDGHWKVIFSSEGPENPALGEFFQTGDEVIGTFLTTTGDYRYLEGIVDGNQLKLSTFDGEHAFLFVADMDSEGNLNGNFWSGEHWHETFTATRDEEFQLPDANSLTYLKEGYEGIEFAFPGLDGQPVSLDDPKYQDKVVLLQIFGTWCPNCMDETKFLTSWYPEVSDQVEIIGLAYERKDDFDYAVGRINKVKERLNVPYDFVVAGTSDKEVASKTLPMLNKIISFPTLIILDKERNIRRIHTGFSGPGTGEHYTEFVEDFKLFMQKLLNEPTNLAS
ncbi:MAG TPA: alkyl hydroperoxide reductase [Cytophagales bacterium]|nr:alkyl hydroperoxide reductase [Cytophagales bacterium]HAP60601.1 alkyl hydroperoxide reductase [Cytophagales bacterium]